MLMATLLMMVAAAAEPEPNAEDRRPTVIERMQERREQRLENRRKVLDALRGDEERQNELLVTAVEAVLSYVLDAPAEVGALQLDTETGHVEIDELAIGNPDDFGDDDAIVMKKAVVKADPGSLFSNEPMIHLIEAQEVTVNSVTSLKGNNLKKLLDNAMQVAGKQPKALGELGAGSEKTWRIEKGVLGGVTVNLITELLTRQTNTKNIEPIEMSFMGEDGKGMPASAAMAKVLRRLVEETGILGEGAGDSPLGNLLGDVLSGG